ncbi:hypothetical protein AB1K91_05290 [Terribacillus sp. 179-K 1B1 HS]|uniref:hypothetical protein n=1 Tax=Terribacillus sp. 179-K 1B1 HS TaxID=3142388 RepID=UPI0039A06BC4
MKIVKDGKEIEVTEKAYNVVYAPLGFKPYQESEELDFYDKSAAELNKIGKEKIKSFLKQEEIEFDSSATKDELISIITGEGDDNGDDNGGSQEDTANQNDEA